MPQKNQISLVISLIIRNSFDVSAAAIQGIQTSHIRMEMIVLFIGFSFVLIYFWRQNCEKKTILPNISLYLFVWWKVNYIWHKTAYLFYYIL